MTPPFSEGARHHDGTRCPDSSKVLPDGEQTRLQIQRVDDRLGQQDVHTRLDQRGHLLIVRIDHLLEGDGAKGGVLNIRRDGHLFGCGADRARHETRPLGICRGHLVRRLSRAADRREVDLPTNAAAARTPPSHRTGAKRIGRHDVSARRQIGPVNVGQFVRMGQAQNVDKAAQLLRVIRETSRPASPLGQLEACTIVPMAPSSTSTRWQSSSSISCDLFS